MTPFKAANPTFFSFHFTKHTHKLVASSVVALWPLVTACDSNSVAFVNCVFRLSSSTVDVNCNLMQWD